MEEKVNQGSVKNPTAYLMKAFQDDYRTPETEYVKLQEEEQQIKKEQEVQQELAQKKAAEEKQAFKERKRITIQSRLSELDLSRVEELKAHFIDGIRQSNSPFYKRIYDLKGFEDGVIQSYWFKYLSKVLLLEEERSMTKFEDTIT